MEIKLQNIDFSYNRNDNKILDAINLKIKSGKVTGIIGNVASGKSTLLALIAGNLIPSKGKIVFDNVIISKRKMSELSKIKLNIGYLSQYPEEMYLFDTVRDDFCAYLESYDINFKIEGRIVEVLHQLNLNIDLLDQNPFVLSSGELRMISVARLLIPNPEIIILDEPTVGLDSVGKQILVNLLTKIKKVYNKTIIIASHDIEFMNKVADEVVVLKEGKVIRSENTSEVFQDTKFLLDNELVMPQIALFRDIVFKQKGIRLMYRTEINDLVKDILRSV